MESFTFGSVSGSTFAFFFFLALSLFIGFAFYRLLLEPRVANYLSTSVSRPKALGIGAGIALLLFLWIYFDTLDGFYQMDIGKGGEEIRLTYILPRRILVLRRGEIAEALRVPAYKTRWQLVLYSPTGRRYTSARAGYARVRQAWERLSTLLPPPAKKE